MKRYFFILIIMLMCSCSTSIIRNDAAIEFSNKSYDFGKIPFKKETSHLFEFKNSGKSSLVIYDVKASCGCTVPEWSKKPIRQGEIGQLNIKYDAAFPGVFQKTLEIFYNGPNSPARIEIKGEVKKQEVMN